MDASKVWAGYQTVYDCVGPVRSAAYEALFFLTDPENMENYRQGKLRGMPGEKQFAAAAAMMETGFDELFQDQSERFPDRLTDLRAQTREMIQKFHRTFFDNRNHENDTVKTINEHAAMIQSEIRPVITDFLGELETFALGCKSVETSRNRAIIDGAINDIENINSTINLIAVNASVEAALAGDAGRGFAVIAAEIQDLSQKSKKVVEDFRSKL